MGIAHKCDVSGTYSDTMDRVKSYEWIVTKLGKTFTIRVSLDVLNANREQLELAPAVWTQVVDEVKARIA